MRPARRLSSGAVGSLRLAELTWSGCRFEETFFFGHQKLEQLELLLLDPGTGPAADEAVTRAQRAVLETLRTELGPELAAFGLPDQTLADTTSWVAGDADVMLFRSGRPGAPTLRVVIRQRQLVDGSQL